MECKEVIFSIFLYSLSRFNRDIVECKAPPHPVIHPYNSAI